MALLAGLGYGVAALATGGVGLAAASEGWEDSKKQGLPLGIFPGIEAVAGLMLLIGANKLAGRSWTHLIEGTANMTFNFKKVALYGGGSLLTLIVIVVGVRVIADRASSKKGGQDDDYGF